MGSVLVDAPCSLRRMCSAVGWTSLYTSITCRWSTVLRACPHWSSACGTRPFWWACPSPQLWRWFVPSSVHSISSELCEAHIQAGPWRPPGELTLHQDALALPWWLAPLRGLVGLKWRRRPQLSSDSCQHASPLSIPFIYLYLYIRCRFPAENWVGSCCFLTSMTICFSTGVFRAFIFKVIINRLGLISTIFLAIFYSFPCSCLPLFCPLSFYLSIADDPVLSHLLAYQLYLLKNPFSGCPIIYHIRLTYRQWGASHNRVFPTPPLSLVTLLSFFHLSEQ